MDERPNLQLVALARGSQLTVYALVRSGRSEVYDFICAAIAEERSLASDLQNILRYIADHEFRTPEAWFRAISGQDGQWEVRKGRHRLMGFVDGRALILCLYRLKDRQKPQAKDLKAIADLRKEWLSDYETPS